MVTDRAIQTLLARPLPKRIMQAVAERGGEARLVGGVVRDVLAGDKLKDETDYDLAVNRPPGICKDWLEAAGLHVIPTGFDHGTITVVDRTKPHIRAEVTSLRADIRTDGRHAEVAFGTDWHTDAERRDFTINALYLSAEGEVFDPFHGRDDLAARRVRFVGDAALRIQEDYLRMLRFFRFHARFGGTVLDAAAMAAIAAHGHGLKHISGERVAREMRGILATGHAGVIKGMVRAGLDRMITPGGFDAEGYARLAPLTARIEPMHSLGYLIHGKGGREAATAMAADLRLSKREAWLVRESATPFDYTPLTGDDWQKAAYGLTRTMTPATLAGLYAVASARHDKLDEGVFARLYGWVRPLFPLTGDDLIARGMRPGQRLGAMLGRLEGLWVEQRFNPPRPVLLKMLDDEAADA